MSQYTRTFDLRGQRIKDTYSQLLQYHEASQSFYSGQGMSTDLHVSSSNSSISSSYANISNASISSSYAPVQPSYSSSVSAQFNTFTSSWSRNSISASWAPIDDAPYSISSSWASASISASYAPVEPEYSKSVASSKQNALVVGGTYLITASSAVSASWAPIDDAPHSISSSWASQSLSASWAPHSETLSASWASSSISTSFADEALSASWAPHSETLSASWASQSLSASWSPDPNYTSSLFGTASQAVSASWAPHSETLSASWASASISSSYVSASYSQIDDLLSNTIKVNRGAKIGGMSDGITSVDTVQIGATDVGVPLPDSSYKRSGAVQIGWGAGQSATTASNAVAIGIQAGTNTKLASNAVQLGGLAGAGTITASNTVQIGISAGQSSIDATNAVQIGSNAGVNATTAIQSVQIGSSAGANAKTGSYTTFIGSGADTLDGGLNVEKSIAIGFNAKVSGSNMAVIGGTGTDAINVGIGTNSPQNTLEVIGNIKATSITASLQGTASNAISASWAPMPTVSNSSSWASQSLSASYAKTASLVSVTDGLRQFGSSTIYSASVLTSAHVVCMSGTYFTDSCITDNGIGNTAISGNTTNNRLEVYGNVKATSFTGSITSSNLIGPVIAAISASWASSSFSSTTASWASQSLSASWSPVPVSASWASSSLSASYIATASWAYNVVNGAASDTASYISSSATFDQTVYNLTASHALGFTTDRWSLISSSNQTHSIDFNVPYLKITGSSSIAGENDLWFSSSINRQAVMGSVIYVSASVDRNLTWNNSWQYLTISPPGNMTQYETLIVSFTCFGPNENDIIASVALTV